MKIMKAKRSAIFYFLFILVPTIFPGCEKYIDCTDCPGQEIKIGALLPLTGSGSSAGESFQAALNIAETDINSYLQGIGGNTRFSYEAGDTGTDTLLAKQTTESFYDKGYRFIIGPYSSASVKAVKPYADNNDLLVISCSSVAPSLAIPGDNIFRLVPSDDRQGQALTALLKDDGIEVIVPIVRDDLWGNELLAVTTEWFSGEGGTVAEAVKYSIATQDFGSKVSELTDNLGSALIQYPAEKTAIYLVSFSEGTDILEAAATQNSLLYEVNWYGSSAFAESKSLITNTAAAGFAISQNLSCPVFGLDDNAIDKWQPLTDEIETVIGRKPEVYALVAYDAAWLTVLSILNATGNLADIKKLKEAFTESAYNYYGATGWTALNDAGDRAYATYDFFGPKKENGSYSWARTARFNNATGELTRY